MTPVVAWFRNDLRLLDNLALLAAIEVASGGGGAVWPVFCLDPRLVRPNESAEPDGAKQADSHRVRFMLQSLAGLQARLQALGSDLLVVHAPASQALPAILAAAAPGSAALVVAQDEPAWPERAVQKRVEEELARASPAHRLQLVWGSTCFHRDDLAFAKDLADMPDSRGSFGVLAERAAHVRFPREAPAAGALGAWPALPHVSEALAGMGFQLGIPSEAHLLGADAAAAGSNPLAVMEFVGGEEAGLARVEEYVWDNEENLELYFETRNGFLGRDFSSKFSPWLALGCLSVQILKSTLYIDFCLLKSLGL